MKNEFDCLIVFFLLFFFFKVKESNARLVEWSDGTLQLFVGDIGYDLVFKKDDTKLMTSFGVFTNFF